jgi:hypothetical protein
MFPVNPNLHFNNAVSKLNRLNLFNLLANSLNLSYIEFFSATPKRIDLLSPVIFGEQISIFQRAILESNSQVNKNLILNAHLYSFIHNEIIGATFRPIKGNEKADLEEIFDVFSKIGNSQFRYQKNRIGTRLGRAYSLLYLIPEKKKALLREKLKNDFFDLTEEIPKSIGLTVKQFLGIGFCIYSKMKVLYNDNLRFIEESEDSINNASSDKEKNLIQYRIISKLIEAQGKSNSPFVITADQLIITQSEIYSIEAVNQYLSLLSKSINKLRSLIWEKIEYREGDIPDRLNPLERYPIIEIFSGQYLIPNARFFYDGITNLLHLIMQDLFLLQPGRVDNRYHQVMGFIQEIYIEELITEKLENIQIITEIKYKKGKEQISGPDIIIIEHQTNRIIIIESKFKHTRNLSKVKPIPTILHSDLLNVIPVFEKLTKKTEDLYFGFKEYESFQGEINKTKDSIPIQVVIIGQGIEFMAEIFNRGLLNKEFKNRTTPYCLIDIETFEDFVDFSSESGTPLSELLTRFYELSKKKDMRETAAEYLVMNKQSYDKKYAWQFSEILLEEIKREFPEYSN